MRRFALLGLILLLPACETTQGIGDFVGNPFDGLGTLLGDTVSLRGNPNLPIGDSPNMQRVMGRKVDTAPLLPEPGNVWPGPPKPQATLQDLQREQNQGQLPPPPTTPVAPHPQPRGSSTSPDLQPLPRAPQPAPQATISRPPPMPSLATPPMPGVVQTPQGPAVITGSGNGVQTYTLPNGSSGRAISNGNGTVTLIGPTGEVQSVPVPR